MSVNSTRIFIYTRHAYFNMNWKETLRSVQTLWLLSPSLASFLSLVFKQIGFCFCCRKLITNGVFVVIRKCTFVVFEKLITTDSN